MLSITCTTFLNKYGRRGCPRSCVEQYLAFQGQKHPIESRGVAMLDATKDLQSKGISPTDLRGVQEIALALVINSDATFKNKSPEERLAFIHQLDETGVMPRLWDYELLFAANVVASDPAFMAADQAGKSAIIDDMTKKKQLSFQAASGLKRQFAK